MSEWITDRRPTEDDGEYVYSPYGNVCHWSEWSEFRDGQPWKPIPKCEPYVKPRRFRASWDVAYGWWRIERDGQWFESLMGLKEHNDEFREAAERIAAIYEEVMP